MDVRVDQTSGQRQRAAERAVLSTSSIGLLAGALGTLADGAGPPDDRRAAAALAARDLERHLDDLSDSGDPEDDQVVLEVEAVVERLRRAAVG
ncbi:hypothetical protein [Patulibacter sp.]|uniref:hypothetical protein n=1 Tax=Patulibacter sp. TaxID=1912859 RepID=UPI0027187F08|nr:hypothetical protein [Patulibacter sp.]MDO9410906.1 hypothetical protein [Patulibacter sp.]